jgi:hypothetical protein
MYFAVAGRAVLLVVFGVAAFGKARTPAAFAEFVDTLRDLRWIREAWRRPLGLGVVGVEVAIPVLLAVPWTAVVGLGLALLTLTAFTAVVAVARLRGQQVRCRCFGSGSGSGSGAEAAVWGVAQMLRNVALIAVAGIALASALTQRSGATPDLFKGAHLLGVLTVTVAVLAPLTVFNLFLLFAVIRRLRTAGTANVPHVDTLPAVGLAVGGFTAATLDGRVLGGDDLAGTPRNVVCFMVGCEPCKTQIAAMRADGGLDRERTLVFVFGDPRGEADRELAASVRDLGTVALLPMGDPVATAFGGIDGFPTLMRTENGRIVASARRWADVGAAEVRADVAVPSPAPAGIAP